MIWKSNVNLAELNSISDNLASLIGIKFTAVSENSLTATMPVDSRTYQPAGILHGGASVVLAETLGSVASNLLIDRESNMIVGLEVNANHLRRVSSGHVTGVCAPIHIGRKTHVWEIKMSDDSGKLTCISRLTVVVLPKSEN